MSHTSTEVSTGKRLVLGIILVLLLPQLWVTRQLAVHGYKLGVLDWVRPFAIVALGLALYQGRAWARWLFIILLSLGSLQYALAALASEDRRTAAEFGAVALGVVGLLAVLSFSSSIRALVESRRSGTAPVPSAPEA